MFCVINFFYYKLENDKNSVNELSKNIFTSMYKTNIKQICTKKLKKWLREMNTIVSSTGSPFSLSLVQKYMLHRNVLYEIGEEVK